MPTEKLEIDIIAKGKPAERAIGNVEKKTEDLGKTTKRTGQESDSMLMKLKAGWLAIGATIALSVNKAVEFERASVGLSREMRQFAKDTALSSQATAEQIAGFLKSAQTAGLADEQMKKLATDAVALGYAFPHEDAETLHDNLVMLNTTGEAQGFIVDILEQQYAKMGKRFEDIDLKAVSVEEKLALVNNVIKDSRVAMEASPVRDFDKAMGQLDNTLSDIGETIVKTGAFSFLNDVLEAGNLIINRFILSYVYLKDLILDTAESEKQFLEQKAKVLELDSKLYGKSHQDELDKTRNRLKELTVVNEELNKSKEKSNILNTEEKDWYDHAKDGIDKYIAGVKDSNNQITEFQNVGIKVAQGLEDAFVNMAMGTKTSFKDMANAIIADLIRIQIRRSVVLPLLGLLHTGSSEVKHTGGTIGGIPSYHTGMRSDERLAKLQVGEAVVNRAGASRNRNAIDAMNAGYQVGGGTGNVTQAEINFNVQAIDASSFNNYLVGNKHTIENIINNSLQTNGTVRRTIKQVI